MTSRPRRHDDRKPESADAPRRIPNPAPPGDDDSAAAASQDPHGGRLAYSVDEAARLTGLSRDLLYDEMRRGNLASVKVGRRRLITRQHLKQLLGIASYAIDPITHAQPRWQPGTTARARPATAVRAQPFSLTASMARWAGPDPQPRPRYTPAQASRRASSRTCSSTSG